MKGIDHRVRLQDRRPSHRARDAQTLDVERGRNGEWVQYLQAVVRRHGSAAVGEDSFEPPRGWDFRAWTRRRQLRDLDRAEAG